MSCLAGKLTVLAAMFFVSYSSSAQDSGEYGSYDEAGLRVEQDAQAGTISIYRVDGQLPILTQNARPDSRCFRSRKPHTELEFLIQGSRFEALNQFFLRL